MKMYVRDLRPGDEFDCDELIARQVICVLEHTRSAARNYPAKVESNRPMTFLDFNDVHFSMGGETYMWALRNDQVVEVKEW